MVFLPSIRYGSLSVDVSNQFISSFPPPTIFPQSSMYPFTRHTLAPCSAISRMLVSGVSSGAKMYVSMPHREQYAESAAPALPFVGIAMRFTPSSLAMDTAITSPRALNEPVGSRPSSFTSSAPPSSRPFSAPSTGKSTTGVAHSPSDTQSSAARTGSSSRHFHSVGGLAASVSRVSLPFKAFRSYRTRSGLPESARPCSASASYFSPVNEHSRCVTKVPAISSSVGTPCRHRVVCMEVRGGWIAG